MRRRFAILSSEIIQTDEGLLLQYRIVELAKILDISYKSAQYTLAEYQRTQETHIQIQQGRGHTVGEKSY